MAENRPASPEQGTTPAKNAVKKPPAKKAAKPAAKRAARKAADPAPEPPGAPVEETTEARGEKATSQPAKKAAAQQAKKAAAQPAKKPVKRAAKKAAKQAAKEPAKPAAKQPPATAVEQPALVPPPESRSTADPAPPVAAPPVPRSPVPTSAVPASAVPSPPVPSSPVPSSPVPSSPVPTSAVPSSPVPTSAAAAPLSAAGTQPAAPGVWAAATWQAVRRPELPPWQLADLAVAELGPRAAAWVDWLRRTYPGVSADAIARLATVRAGRLGRAAAVLGLGGPVAALVGLPAAGWVRASVVLRVAAAYGHDPTDPRRASDLLELLDLAPEGNLPDQPAEPGSAGARVGALLRRLDRLQATIVPLGLGRSAPLLPLRAALRSGEAGDSVDRLAHRAIRRYRPGSQSSTEASARSSSSA